MRNDDLVAWAGAIALLALLYPLDARASQIQLSCGGVAVADVTDDLAGDDDPDPNQIQFDFLCTAPDARWTGNGRVIGQVGPDGFTLTQLTDFTASNNGIGPVAGLGGTGFLDIFHTFAVFWPDIATSAWLDGYYDNVDGALLIGGANVAFNPYVDGANIGLIDPVAADSVAPTVPFFGVSGPLLDPDQAVFEHHLQIDFYLDSPGDAIVLPDSAFIRSPVPEPGTGALLLLGTALTAALRRRSRARCKPRAIRIAERCEEHRALPRRVR